MPSRLLPAALNVRSMIEDEINREFTDIDNLISASIESQGEAGAFDLLRLLRPPAPARPKPILAHRGLVLELQGCEAAVLSLRSQDKG
jgi:hypothetical protein